MDVVLKIGGQKGGMEHQVDFPCGWKFQFIK